MNTKKPAFIFATENEAMPFLSSMQGTVIHSLPYCKIFEGIFAGTNILLAVSGIGKIKAALAANALIEKFSVTYIINLGYAGLLNKEILKKGGIFIATDSVQYDFDLSALDNCPAGYHQDIGMTFLECDKKMLSTVKKKNFNAAFGRVASGDRFLSSPLESEKLINEFSADVCDMELAAIMFTAKLHNIPVFAVKIISDVVGNEDDYYEAGDLIKKTVEIAVFVLNNITL